VLRTYHARLCSKQLCGSLVFPAEVVSVGETSPRNAGNKSSQIEIASNSALSPAPPFPWLACAMKFPQSARTLMRLLAPAPLNPGIHLDRSIDQRPFGLACARYGAGCLDSAMLLAARAWDCCWRSRKEFRAYLLAECNVLQIWLALPQCSRGDTCAVLGWSCIFRDNPCSLQVVEKRKLRRAPLVKVHLKEWKPLELWL
jgi:hypothetical protein